MTRHTKGHLFFSFLFLSFSVLLRFFLKDPPVAVVTQKLLSSFCIYTHDVIYILTKCVARKQHFAKSNCAIISESCCVAADPAAAVTEHRTPLPLPSPCSHALVPAHSLPVFQLHFRGRWRGLGGWRGMSQCPPHTPGAAPA